MSLNTILKEVGEAYEKRIDMNTTIAGNYDLKHGKQSLKSFLLKEVERAYKLGYENGFDDGQSIDPTSR